MLKHYVDVTHLLIGVEGAKTPAGVAVTGDPAGVSDEEAPGTPANRSRLEWKSTDNLSKPIKKDLKRIDPLRSLHFPMLLLIHLPFVSLTVFGKQI